ncbi:hypothetical protein [Streptomyces sp. NPDC087512]
MIRSRHVPLGTHLAGKGSLSVFRTRTGEGGAAFPAVERRHLLDVFP